MSAGLLLPLPVKLSTFSTAPSSLSTPTLFTVSFAKTISNNLIFVKQSLSSKRPDFRVFADDGDADGGGTDEYDMDEDEVEEADNKKDFDVDYDTLLGGGSAIALAVARGDDDIAMVNSSSFVFTQGWDSEKIVDYRIKEEEFHKICLFDCDFFIRKPPDPDNDVYDFREMYVTPPDTDIYAIPRVLAPMPQKYIRCAMSDYGCYNVTEPPIDAPRDPMYKSEREITKVTVPGGKSRDRKNDLLVIRDNGNSFKIIPSEERDDFTTVIEKEEWKKTRNMGSIGNHNKPHAVCIPYPAQGHINPMLKLAKILNYKGFHITFVNNEYNHRRLLKSRGPDSLKGLPSFQFETIPDGLPPCDADSTQDIPALCESTTKTCLGPFKELLAKLNDTCSSNVPPVSCIISDGCMSFTLAAAQELGIPEVFFWTPSACGFLGYMHYHELAKKGYFPLKDASDLTNGYLETALDWIPGMKDIRLRDLPSFLRSTNPDDFLFNYLIQETNRSKSVSAIVVNTFDPLEKEVLESLQTLLPPVYAIGPLHFLVKHIEDKNLERLGSNLWKEDPKSVEWLDSKKPNSVVYVNFGSITVMTANQLIEFAWGLANSQMEFLWIIRPDIVSGEEAILPPEFVEETKERGMLTSWCPQEQVLSHPAIGGFLTHSGWNSTLESIGNGVPMICWPFFAEQQTNCWFKCTQWGIGMEIDNNVKRDEVESLVRELMVGEKGRDMKKKAMEWKKSAEEAAAKPTGSSYVNIDKLINEILLKH